MIVNCIRMVYAHILKELDVVQRGCCCPSCRAPLDWFSMVPILGCILSKGKCKHCGSLQPIRFPVIELMSGILFLMTISCFHVTAKAICIGLIFIVLLCVAWIDLDTMWIPDFLMILLVVLAVWLSFYQPELSTFQHVMGSVGIAVPMILMNQIMKDSFGGGDIKLMLVSGWMLGFEHVIVAGLIAVFTAGSYAWILLNQKRATRKDHIAFGPFLCLGIILSMCYGTQLITLYTSL